MADFDKEEGRLKQAGGALTGDEDLKDEGEAQETWGKAKDKADDVFDEAKEKL